MPDQSSDLALIQADQSGAAAAATPEVVGAVQGEKQTLEIAKLRIENESLKQDTTERKTYALRIFCMVSGWLGFVGVIVVIAGFKWLGRWPFYLSDNVLIALLTTATATVVGVLLIVANYLFPKRS